MLNPTITGATNTPHSFPKHSKSRIQTVLLPVGYAASCIFILVACLLFQLLYDDFSPWILVPSFLFISVIGTTLARSGAYGMHTCVLTYSTCAMVAAIAQNYSTSYFGSPMSQPDSNLFYKLVLDKSYSTMEQLETVVNAPLAVYIWKFIYKAISPINGSGPAAGPLFNSSLVGIAGALTIKSAKILFGEDTRRLYKVSLLFSMCGLVWLFGALFLRDSFALFFNTLTLWAMLKWLNKQSIANLVLAAALLSASGFAMTFIREESAPLFIAFAALVIGVGFLKGGNPVIKILILGVIFIVAILGYNLISDHFDSALAAAEQGEQSYSKWAKLGSGADSLGVAFVTSQPIFIRATIGSIYILIMPIPVWGYLQLGLVEYHLIKGYHAVYMMLLMPLLMGGIIQTCKLFFNGKQRNLNYTLITTYFLATLISVAATSLETRHLGQFATSMVLLAAIPGNTTKAEIKRMRNLKLIWLVIVIAIYLAWTVLKFFR